MVRTSTAEKNKYRCPACGDELKQDKSGRGYVAHVSNPHCRFEKGEKDILASRSYARRVTRPIPPDHKPTDGVRLCGYSERGVFNALLYEIGFSADPIDALVGLLSLIRIPGTTRDFSTLQGAEVLVEQSLSDFGDADVILLLHGIDWHSTVFVEGKVKSSQVGTWTVQSAWDKFLARKGGKLDSSNLFTQLYYKVRFVSALRKGGIDEVERGVSFPECSTKTIRKLGNNPVVVRAAQMIEAYAGDCLYVAAVPDSASNLCDFYNKPLAAGPAHDLTGWSTEGWGYLAWEEVEQYCRQHELNNTVRVFDFNRGQIY